MFSTDMSSMFYRALPIPMSVVGMSPRHRHVVHVSDADCRPARFLKLGAIGAHQWHLYAQISMLVPGPTVPSSFSLPPTTTRPMGCSNGGNTLNTTDGAAARAVLEANGWTIHDGGRTNIEPANPGECPSGYFEVPSPYGQSQCIAPSDTACAEQSLNAACTFSAGGISGGRRVFESARAIGLPRDLLTGRWLQLPRFK